MAENDSITCPRNVKDISGKKFGSLTAISYAGKNLGSQSGAYWICRCECGFEKTICGRSLRSGSIKSCGCSKSRTDETGNIYNKLTVLEFAGSTKSGDSRWLCKCECGNTTIVARGDFRNNSIKSCGCHRASAGGMCKSSEYAIWKGMKSRCYIPTATEYANYGGRGIKICDRWKKSFNNFFNDMGPKPFLDASIDRIDVNGNYEPDNCRWATVFEQGQNTRKTKLLTYNGETYGLREWARRLGITHRTLSIRIAKGWPPEKIFSTEHHSVSPPKKQRKTN